MNKSILELSENKTAVLVYDYRSLKPNYEIEKMAGSDIVTLVPVVLHVTIQQDKYEKKALRLGGNDLVKLAVEAARIHALPPQQQTVIDYFA